MFLHSYRVRLKEFRTNYNIAAILIVVMLGINVVFYICKQTSLFNNSKSSKNTLFINIILLKSYQMSLKIEI